MKPTLTFRLSGVSKGASKDLTQVIQCYQWNPIVGFTCVLGTSHAAPHRFVPEEFQVAGSGREENPKPLDGISNGRIELGLGNRRVFGMNTARLISQSSILHAPWWTYWPLHQRVQSCLGWLRFQCFKPLFVFQFQTTWRRKLRRRRRGGRRSTCKFNQQSTTFGLRMFWASTRWWCRRCCPPVCSIATLTPFRD